jgi:recombination protein RecR
MYSSSLKKLIEHFKILPGVGPKTAQRMAFHILAQNKKHQAKQLAETMLEALDKIKHCGICRNFCDDVVCEICQSTKREENILCIVESPQDIIAIEQTGNFNGKYFVLHGKLSPLDNIGPKEIGLDMLFSLLSSQVKTEIIIATNSTVEGEATAYYIAKQAEKLEINCSRIAHGIPMGGELEYLDNSTLAYALQARVSIQATID